MNDSIEQPSLSSRIFARFLSIIQFVAIGPPALLSTIVTVVICSVFYFPCAAISRRQKHYDNNNIKNMMNKC